MLPGNAKAVMVKRSLILLAGMSVQATQERSTKANHLKKGGMRRKPLIIACQSHPFFSDGPWSNGMIGRKDLRQTLFLGSCVSPYADMLSMLIRPTQRCKEGAVGVGERGGHWLQLHAVAQKNHVLFGSLAFRSFLNGTIPDTERCGWETHRGGAVALGVQ